MEEFKIKEKLEKDSFFVKIILRKISFDKHNIFIEDSITIKQI